MVAHRHKKIKEQFASTDFHLHLHGSAALESLATSDNQCQKVRSQSGVLVGGVIVCIPSGPEDHIDRDSHLQTLFPESQALQFIEAELFGAAVDDGVFEENSAHSVVIDCRLYRSTALTVRGVLQLPGVAPLVVEESGIVVSFVEVFEDRGEDFGFSEGRISLEHGFLEKLQPTRQVIPPSSKCSRRTGLGERLGRRAIGQGCPHGRQRALRRDPLPE